MTTEVINIQIREDGSRVVTRNIEGMGTAATKAAGPLDRLKGLIATVVTGAAVAQLARLADEYTNLQNRLRLVTTGTENLKRVTSELLTVANQTRSDFTATGELYARLASTTKDLGLSQQQLLSFTKQVNQAIVLSGASASEAAGGLRQLAQGLASGVLRGDELNSVMENFPKVATIIAEGMGKSIGEIRKLGEEGKISAEAIITAFDKAKDQLDSDFGKTIPTLSQSFTVFKNNFLSFLGQLNESTGVTATLSKLILQLANNLDVIIPIITGVGLAIAAAFVPGIITAFMTQIKALWALMLANPFVAVAAIITGVITVLYAFRDQIKLGIDETTTLGDLCRAVWEDIKSVISGVIGFITSLYKDATSSWNSQTESSTEKQESMWLKLPRTVLNVFDAIGAVVRGAMMGVAAVVMKVIENISDNFKTLGQAVTAAMSGDFETMADKLASNKSALADVGKAWGDAMSSSMQMQVDGGFVAWFDEKVKRAQQIGKDRLADAGKTGELEGGGPKREKPGKVDKGAAAKAAKELERLKDALRSIQDAIDPVGAAERQLAEAHDTLIKSTKAGLITQTQQVSMYEALKETMKDQLDPLGALNRELDTHIETLKMSSEQAEIETRVRQSLQDLQRSGKTLTEEETAALRAKLIVEQELAKIAAARDSIEDNSFAGQIKQAQEMIAGMQAANELTDGDRFNVLNQLLGGSMEETQAAMDARMQQLDTYYKIAQDFRDADVKNAQLAAQAMAAIEQERMNIQVAQVQTGLTAISGLMSSHNKTAFRIGQAAAIANATITGITTAMNAYESASKIPYVGWILGPLAAAGAAAAAAASISKIRSQQPPAYRTGGSYTIGGSGGIDSQEVRLRGTPGEKIHINTPHQANAMDRIANSLEQGGGQRGDVIFGDTVIMQQGRANNETAEQQARAFRKQAEKMEF